jgi:SAM-dependent methyltransferase
VIKAAFISLSRSFPRLRKVIWKQLYQLAAAVYENPRWTFMNFGYSPETEESLELLPQDEPDRFFIQMYRHILGGESLRDRDVVEIGCGRGGGCSYVGRYLRPRSVCGVDLAENVVRYCRQRHPVPAVRFVTGDAESLPFPDASFDAALNVESSHCYPSFTRFLGEVGRILRPGGTLHLADLRDSDGVEEFHAAVAASQMRIERRADITRNVMEAVRRDGARRVEHFERTLPRPLARFFREFAGSEGTIFHRKLVRGEVLYFSYILRKPR